MSWRPCPESKVVSGVSVLDQALFRLEHIVQDLIELPFPKLRVQDLFLGQCIPVRSMLLIGILDSILLGLLSFSRLFTVIQAEITGSFSHAVISCRYGFG